MGLLVSLVLCLFLFAPPRFFLLEILGRGRELAVSLFQDIHRGMIMAVSVRANARSKQGQPESSCKEPHF